MKKLDLPRIGIALPVCLLILLGIALFASTGLAAQTAIQIPVIVNIYTNAGVNEAGAREAIKEANKALKQANMQMVVVKVQNATEGDAGNDGKFSQAERTALRTFGGKELNKLPNQKGIKISFGETPSTETPATPGVSIHRDPTIIVKNRATAALTGQTIAHELGHVMTLGPKHLVTPTQRADDGGHTPNTAGETGKENLMAPSNYRTDTKLTAAQIAEMNARKYFVGKCSTQFSNAFPAIKDKQQFGTKTDENNDQGAAPSLFDLHQTFLTSLDGAANIQSQLTVAAPLPTGSPISAQYTLGFDSDQNAATGIAYSGLSGVDKIVEILANGTFGTPGFSLSGVVRDALNPLIVDPLTSVKAVIDDALYDIDTPGDPTATSFLFDIPKSLLGITSLATDLPVVATAGDGLSIFDDSIFDFDLTRWLDDPTLETFGNGTAAPGQPYAFSVSGLEPLSPFNLLLDGDIITSGILDSLGEFSGSFIFPSSLPVDQFHFLTAQDSTGEFAYSMVCPTPEPGTMLLLGSGVAGLIWFQRRRRLGG